MNVSEPGLDLRPLLLDEFREINLLKTWRRSPFRGERHKVKSAPAQRTSRDEIERLIVPRSTWMTHSVSDYAYILKSSDFLVVVLDREGFGQMFYGVLLRLKSLDQPEDIEIPLAGRNLQAFLF
jgi:hypothetical protein